MSKFDCRYPIVIAITIYKKQATSKSALQPTLRVMLLHTATVISHAAFSNEMLSAHIGRGPTPFLLMKCMY